jgi:hypothetical protein
MDVDAKSESESEDEVCACFIPWSQHFIVITSYLGRGIFLSGFTGTPGSAQAHSRVLSPQVGLPCYCLGYQGAYHIFFPFDFLIEPKSASLNRN